MIEKVNDNTIYFEFNNKKYTIFFSFGLDKEIVSIIGDFYKKYMSNKSSVVDMLTKTDEISIEDMISSIKSQPADIYDTIVNNLSLYFDTVAKIGSLFLSVRDDKGKIVEYVSETEILYSKEYNIQEGRELLLELFKIAMDRFTQILSENKEENENPPEGKGEGKG